MKFNLLMFFILILFIVLYNTSLVIAVCSEDECTSNYQSECRDLDAYGNEEEQCCGVVTPEDGFIDMIENTCCKGVFFLNTISQDTSSCSCGAIIDEETHILEIQLCDIQDETLCWDTFAGACCGNTADDNFIILKDQISDVLVLQSCINSNWFIYENSDKLIYHDIWIK